MNENPNKARTQPKGSTRAQPAKSAWAPVARWKIFAGAAIIVLAGGFGISQLLGDTSADHVSESEKAQMVAAFSKLSAAHVTAVPASDVPSALDSMRLAPDARRALQHELQPAPAPSPGAAPQQQATQLAWITVWDSRDEDGDTIALSSAGYETSVVLTHAPQRIAMPVDASATIKITGVRDGRGGGITLGVQSASGMVALPVMTPGQVLSLPVAF